MNRAIAVIGLAIGCVRTASIECRDGRTCPANTLCDEAHHQCASYDQRDQCSDKPDRTPCTSDATIGLCDTGFCVAACGDGDRQAGEECDDGNNANHDGCSSICTLEVATWTQLADPWLPRVSHAAAYDSARDRLVVFGGGESGTAARDETWTFQYRSDVPDEDCDDGIDDDGDGLVDLEDPDCAP